MKIKLDIDIANFLLSVQKCKGEVLFKTPQGDVINLKSTLSSYIFTTIYAHLDILESGVVVCYNLEDKKALAEFLIGD